MKQDQTNLVSRLRAMAQDRRWQDVAAVIDQEDSITITVASLLVAELSEFGGIPWLQALSRRGASLDEYSSDGVTALGHCIIGAQHRYPTLDLFIELLAAGADPNLPSRSGSTPLQMAIEDNKPEYAIILLLWGADVGGGCALGGAEDARVTANQSGRGWAKDLLRRWCGGNESSLRERLSKS